MHSLLGWIHSILLDRDLEEAAVHVQGLVSPQGTGLEAHGYMGRAFLYSWDLALWMKMWGVEFSNLQPIKAEQSRNYSE